MFSLYYYECHPDGCEFLTFTVTRVAVVVMIRREFLSKSAKVKEGVAALLERKIADLILGLDVPEI